MTPKFNALRMRMEIERDNLYKSLKNTASLLAERHGSHSEGGEFAAEILEVGKGLIIEKRIHDQLADVKHALDKLDQGTYGLCDICGQPIEPARLEALPHASLCLNCKARQAKNGR